ncbi:putative tRNA synthetase [Cyclospora cayetanensis]|uniref:valine--tRNA ligase n=1 Tax=Cyclospora cayetanensis TaxID=88456 RepID=A0A1D3CYR8_9EIME|nr:putative tRNA synthetase [Cyclospora cayetanensis]
MASHYHGGPVVHGHSLKDPYPDAILAVTEATPASAASQAYLDEPLLLWISLRPWGPLRGPQGVATPPAGWGNAGWDLPRQHSLQRALFSPASLGNLLSKGRLCSRGLHAALHDGCSTNSASSHGTFVAAAAREALQLCHIFPFNHLESTLLQWWEAQGLFDPIAPPQNMSATAPAPAAGHGSSFCMAPPNLTGTLHAGHILSCTLQDALFRFERQKSISSLRTTPQTPQQHKQQRDCRPYWVPGVDHAGIGLQMLLERHFNKRHKSECERQLLLLHRWVRFCKGAIQRQQRLMGAGCWWKASCSTLDAHAVSQTRSAFILLHDMGLIRRQPIPLQVAKRRRGDGGSPIVIPNDLIELKDTLSEAPQHEQQGTAGGVETQGDEEEALVASLLRSGKWAGGLFVEMPLVSCQSAANPSNRDSKNIISKGEKSVEGLLVPVGSVRELMQITALVVDDAETFRTVHSRKALVPLVKRTVPVLLQERGDWRHPHAAAASKILARRACSGDRSTSGDMCGNTKGSSAADGSGNSKTKKRLKPAFAAFQWIETPGDPQLPPCVTAAIDGASSRKDAALQQGCLQPEADQQLEQKQQEDDAREKALLTVLLLAEKHPVHLSKQQPGHLVASLTKQQTETRAKEQWILAADRLAPDVDSPVRSHGMSASSTSGAFVKLTGMEVVPPRYGSELLEQLQAGRSWCISRQGWWGIPVPAYLVLQQSQVMKLPKSPRGNISDASGERESHSLERELVLQAFQRRIGGNLQAERQEQHEPLERTVPEMPRQHSGGSCRPPRVDAPSPSCSCRSPAAGTDPHAEGLTFTVAALDEESARRKAVDLIQKQQQACHQRHPLRPPELKLQADTDVLDTWFSSALWPLTSFAHAEELLQPPLSETAQQLLYRQAPSLSGRSPQQQQVQEQQPPTDEPESHGEGMQSDSPPRQVVPPQEQQPAEALRPPSQKRQQRQHEETQGEGLLSCFPAPRMYPYTCLVTGHDILPFWVARQLLLCVALCGALPFSRILIHPLLTDAGGRKLSKSRGNAPKGQLDQWLKKYGADAVRLSLLACCGASRMAFIEERKVQRSARGLIKLWNGARLLLHMREKLHRCSRCTATASSVNLCAPSSEFLSVAQRCALSSCSRMCEEVYMHLEGCNVAAAAARLWEFWESELAEGILPAAQVETELADQICKRRHLHPRNKRQHQERHPDDSTTLQGRLWPHILGWIFRDMLRALHPFAPFISEALSLALFCDFFPSGTARWNERSLARGQHDGTSSNHQADPWDCKDANAEAAFSVIKAAVSCIRRALQEGSNKSVQQPSRQERDSEAGSTAAAAASTTPNSEAEEALRGCSLSLHCSDETISHSLEASIPLMAGLCGIPPECLTVELSNRKEQKPSFLSRVLLLPEIGGSKCRAVTLGVSLSFRGRAASFGGSTSEAPVAHPIRHRLSLQRKLEDLQRRMQGPHFDTRAPQAIKEKLRARLEELQQALGTMRPSRT